MEWYLKVLRQYADFNGRARRKEYWMFVLFNMIFALVAIGLDYAIFISYLDMTFGFIYFVYLLAIIVPALAVTIRRLHDTGKSGWMIFVALIPLIGGIWLLILYIQDSTPGTNQYGPNPKGIN
jgi:uncharacterized membrane protein YhaH (DUF805 family)